MVRKRLIIVSIVKFFICFWIVGCVGLVDADHESAALKSGVKKLLVFSRTEGFRHSSIPDGQKMIQEIGLDNGWIVDLTEDPLDFSESNLVQYAAVIWLNTTGDVLDTAEELAFENYITNGGGYIGIHSAADTEYDWPFYGELMGAYFKDHPVIQAATMTIEESSHPSVSHLGTEWIRTDEWYNYRSNPRHSVTVVISLNETTYTGGTMGDHPIAWYHEVGSGRAFYTGCGHTSDSYISDPEFRGHIEGAIRWAGRMDPVLPVTSYVGLGFLLLIFSRRLAW